MTYLWVFDRDAAFAIPFISAALFMLGGGGLKWIRRIVLPVFLGISALSLGCPWWACGLSAALLGASTTLAYGNEVKQKWGTFYDVALLLVGIAWGLSLLPLFVVTKNYWFILIAPALLGTSFAGLTLCSQACGFPPWKVVEATVGFIIGLFVLLTI